MKTSKLDIHRWFPTTIGVVDYIDFDSKKYKPLLLENRFNIHKDENFSTLTNWITNHVNEYAKEHKFVYEYVPKESFSVRYKVGDVQNYHPHNGFHISAVFYVEGYEDDTPIMFKSPYFVDSVAPQGIEIHDGELEQNIQTTNPDKYNPYTFPTCQYPPSTGRLLIFRSYLEHAVLKKTNDKERISLGYNFLPR